jgi:hypothetical protein
MKPILFVILLSGSLISWGQTDSIAQLEIRAVIDQLFDGMRSGDSSLVRAVFHHDARLMSTLIKNETEIVHDGSIEEFISAIGTPHDEIWDERISNVQIQVDAGLAQAWMDYSFYLGDELSHSGVNAFQLVKVENGWQIIQLMDTRRKGN